MPKPSPESPSSFEAWLPAEHRKALWLPLSTTTLTLAMPDDGLYRQFHVRYAPIAKVRAHNVAACSPWEPA